MTTTIDNTPKSLHVSTTGSFGQLETSKVVDSISPDDIIQSAKLDDWYAVMYPNMTPDDEPVPVNAQQSHFIRQEYIADNFLGISPQYIGEITPDKIKSHGKVFAPKVSGSYKIIQYTEGVTWLTPYTDEGLVNIEDYLLLDSGAILAVNALIPDEVIAIRGSEDVITPYFITVFSHDGKTPRGVMFSSFRAICKNTLLMAIAASQNKMGKFFGFDSKKNVSPTERMALARKHIDFARTQFHEETEPQLQALNNLTLDANQIDIITRDLFTIGRLQEVPLYLEEDETYPAAIKNYHKFMGIYDELAQTDLFNAGESNGYRYYNAATSFVKTLGKDSGFEPYSGFRANMFSSVRKNALKYLEQLLPAKHIGA
jgi:hypothetical protein